MLFNSYIFLFLFLPLVLIGYFLLAKLKRNVFQKGFLLASSLVFYAYFNWAYLALIVASILVNYGLAALIVRYIKKVPNHKKKTIAFVLAVLFNLLLLGFFKYYDFFITNVNQVFGTGFVLLKLLLPLGISFFTFQQLSFVIAVYKEEETIRDLLSYAVFVAFFPQLVAGPIVLYQEMMPQFADESRRRFRSENFAKGLYIFLIGLFKKVVIADTVALFVNNGYSSDGVTFSIAWAMTLSYSLQIYFDFSGYSDMAIGLGKMFNIDIPQNFLSPYLSKSITEFWRRWHITLGRAMKTYVYIPLGGNQKGKVRTIVNLVLTFLVSGLWHGAAWTFVVWGMAHGVFMMFERLAKKPLAKIPGILRIAGTFLVVNCLWVLFRADSLAQAFSVYKAMFSLPSFDLIALQSLTLDGIITFPPVIAFLYLVGFLGVSYGIVFFAKNSTERFLKFKPTIQSVMFVVFLAIISIIHLSRISPFIYFNF